MDKKFNELVFDEAYLKSIIAKVPSDFKARLENTLKPFMKENFTQWLDIFRLYAFVCFEENDENIRILEDSYHEGGLFIFITAPLMNPILRLMKLFSRL